MRRSLTRAGGGPGEAQAGASGAAGAWAFLLCNHIAEDFLVYVHLAYAFLVCNHLARAFLVCAYLA